MKASYDNYVEHKKWEKDAFAKVQFGAPYDWEIKRACGGVRAGLRIAEIGFGNGEFLGWARSKGHKIVGIEILEELTRRAKEAGFDTAPSIDTLLATSPSSFDVVAAFDVLEHIELAGLVDLLKKVHSLLCPGGVLLARFPNGDSPFGLVYQNGDLTHQTILAGGAVSLLMKQAGFTSFRLCTPCERPGFTGVAKQLIKLPFQFCLETALKYLYFGRDMPRTLAMNYILIAQKTSSAICPREK